MKNKKSRNTQGMRQWKKFKRNKMAVIALILLGILIFASAFAPLLTSYDPEAISLTERTLAPSKTHLLGTDKVGRDVFTRLLYGGRISILIGLTGALGGAIIYIPDIAIVPEQVTAKVTETLTDLGKVIGWLEAHRCNAK